MFTVELETLKEQLKTAINDDRITFKPLSTEKGSYAIKFPPNHRIARFVYVERKDLYKCVCDDDECKELFEKIGIKYKDKPGYKLYETKKEAKFLLLSNANDTKAFLLDVTREYIRLKDNN